MAFARFNTTLCNDTKHSCLVYTYVMCIDISSTCSRGQHKIVTSNHEQTGMVKAADLSVQVDTRGKRTAT